MGSSLMPVELMLLLLAEDTIGVSVVDVEATLPVIVADDVPNPEATAYPDGAVSPEDTAYPDDVANPDVADDTAVIDDNVSTDPADDIVGRLYELDAVMVAVVTVADVVQVEEDEDEDEAVATAAAAAAADAAPTISAISSEKSRDGENARAGLKAISRPSSVNGEIL